MLAKTEYPCTLSHEMESEILSISQIQSNLAISNTLAHEAILQDFLTNLILQSYKIYPHQNLIKFILATQNILIPMTIPLADYSLASAGRQIHAHADIYARRRKLSVAHKSGRQFFGMDVRGFRTRSQDDAKEGYKLDRHEISISGR